LYSRGRVSRRTRSSSAPEQQFSALRLDDRSTVRHRTNLDETTAA
jgi:hypothetical protein